jgi:putative FmdB family regulatory protein
MPVYDYECHVCGHRFSEVMGVTEHEIRKQRCSKCGSEDTEPLIQAAYVATSKKS